ncbi:MAG TPA: helix-turn-helix domain-containing protein [Ktedonobacterales bacterium]
MARSSALAPVNRGSPRKGTKPSPRKRATRVPRLLYSIPEAGEALGVSPATAYRLARRGVIFTVEDFGAKKVPVKWLEEEIARRSALARSA